MENEPKFNLTITATEFFRSQIQEASSACYLELTEDVEFYLVDLMCKFIHMEGRAENVEEVFGKPLAFMLKDALEGPKEQRIKHLKKLGDTSLYVSGFFQEYFNGKCIGIDYYISMGSGAYNSIAEITAKSPVSGQRSEVFEELATSFGSLVETIATVSDKLSPMAPTNLLEMYSRWTQNNSERLRKKLEESGILAIPTNINSAQ